MGVWVLLMLVGCDELFGVLSTDSDTDGGPSSPLSTFDVEGTTDSDGFLAIEIDVEPGQSSFMVTAWSTRSTVSLESITDPDGQVVWTWEDWWDASENLTGALYPFYDETFINWPVRAEDPALEPGTYTVVLSAVNSSWYPAQNKPIEAVVQVKEDTDLDQGTVTVNIVWAEGLDEDDDLVAALDEALVRWEQIWGDVGLTLDARVRSSEVEPSTEVGDTGSINNSYWADVDEAGVEDALTLVLGEGILGESDYYGLAGGIPGTLLPSDRSVVIVSMDAHAGSDGRFDEEETRILGETMAHETGHYMGLYHPVEIGWSETDAIDDTSSCRNQSACEDALSDNLMFPYPVCTWQECGAQGDISDGQDGVLQRYIGTLDEP